MVRDQFRSAVLCLLFLNGLEFIMVKNVFNRLYENMSLEVALDGTPPKLFYLQNKNGMSITLMDIGATWLSCEVLLKDEIREILLGINNIKDHQKQKVYLGATVGRYANRIKSGKFKIDGVCYQTVKNELGNTLHGGALGLDKVRWSAMQIDKQTVEFSYLSPDNDQGFPGNLLIKVQYLLSDSNEIIISYFARTDKKTPVNLTNHAYFNLLGAESRSDCLTHKLMIKSNYYFPTDEEGISLAQPKSVKNSSFNFNRSKLINHDFLIDEDQKRSKGYDHSFLLNKEDQDAKIIIAEVVSPDTKILLEVKTTMPAIHLYTGNYLAGTPSRNGLTYNHHAGLALETQFPPNSPNHPEWKQQSCILAPEQTYEHTTSFKVNF